MRNAAASLGRRAAEYFIAPAEPNPPGAAVTYLRPPSGDELAPPPRRASPPPATRLPPRVAVLGRPGEAVPVAVAVANALRAGEGVSAAVVAVWSPPTPVTEPGSSPPSTLAASRLAARLTARGLGATARGRLAWLRLSDHPVAAALAVRRVSGSVDVPVVAVLAGPRTTVLEGLLREQDLVIVVTGDPGGPLGRLAVATSEAPAVACAPLRAGPGRMLAAAGIAGPRALEPRVRTALARLAEPVPIALTPRGAAR